MQTPARDWEQASEPPAAKRARRHSIAHCVPLPATPLRFFGTAAVDDDGDDAQSLEPEHVARLVRRKQQAKRANAGRYRVKCSQSPEAPDAELLKVFEFQSSAPEAARSPLERPRSDEEELESCARHLQQLKWWLQQRVREKLLRAQRKVHRSLDMQNLSPLNAS